MKIRLTLILSIAFFLLGGLSCNECGKDNPTKVKAVDFSWQTPNLNSTISDSFYISIAPKLEYYSERESGFSFINSAYACSPALPKSQDRISNIEIYANVDFNSNLTAGVNLASIFDINFLNDYESNFVKSDLSFFLTEKPLLPIQSSLLLKEAPESTKNFQFTVKIYLDGVDLDFYEFTTNSIEIRTN